MSDQPTEEQQRLDRMEQYCQRLIAEGMELLAQSRPLPIERKRKREESDEPEPEPEASADEARSQALAAPSQAAERDLERRRRHLLAEAAVLLGRPSLAEPSQ